MSKDSWKTLETIVKLVPSIMVGKEAVKLVKNLIDIHYLDRFGQLHTIPYKKTIPYKLLQFAIFMGAGDLMYDKLSNTFDFFKYISENGVKKGDTVEEEEADGGDKD